LEYTHAALSAHWQCGYVVRAGFVQSQAVLGQSQAVYLVTALPFNVCLMTSQVGRNFGCMARQHSTSRICLLTSFSWWSLRLCLGMAGSG